jgi:hypothetical protein
VVSIRTGDGRIVTSSPKSTIASVAEILSLSGLLLARVKYNYGGNLSQHLDATFGPGLQILYLIEGPREPVMNANYKYQ